MYVEELEESLYAIDYLWSLGGLVRVYVSYKFLGS